MRILKTIAKTVFVCSLFYLASCAKKLDEFNENPNGVDPSTANPNLTLPTVLSATANSYLGLGFGKIGGVVQHMQEDGWFSGYNAYDWNEEDWSGWYSILRNNQFLLERATAMNYPLHIGIAQTMRAFIFGTITDLWGDAPYTEALRGGTDIPFPAYDTQETIYKGIIEELKTAVTTLSNVGDATSYYAPGYDIYYGGDASKWKKFANTLLLRYAMRLSAKLPDLARTTLEGVYASGDYMQSVGDDATMHFAGIDPGRAWPNNTANDPSESGWRRRKAASTLINKLSSLEDPRREVWFQPVHVRWVVDNTLTIPLDSAIRENGVKMLTPMTTVSLPEVEFRKNIAEGKVYTRHYNPALFVPSAFNPNPPLTDEYVGIPPALMNPDYYNSNPTPGHSVENQHVSQLSYKFQQKDDGPNGILKARLATSAEAAFILAEAAQKGWNAGNAETHYNNGVKFSLQSWGVGDSYNDYIDNPGVAFDGTQEQILEQKWIAGFANALEAWFDWRRTGFPALAAPGDGSQQPVLPLRLIYGNNEININKANAEAAIDRNTETNYSTLRKKNSQWAKTWLIEGTGKPW